MINDSAATLRDLISQGRPLLGGWCALPGSVSAEIMARCGYDWICVDRQHGLIDDQEAVHMLQALAITSTPTLVRVEWTDPASIMRALDFGAQGVIVPMVNSPEEAAVAAGACRYPPLGYRSWGPLRSTIGSPEYSPTVANRDVICLVMVETQEGYRRLDDILAVSGVDGIFVGPNDLAISNGLPLPREQNQVQNELHEERIASILSACARVGKVAGIACNDAETGAKRSAEGFRVLALSADAALITDGSKQMLDSIRGSSHA